jgi:hypothetical protein
VIAPEIRRAVLAHLPAGISCLNAAAGLDAIDPATPHVLVEGIEDRDDPIAFLTLVRERLPNARLFALVANAAHLPALAAFYAGRAPAAGHPLVRDEIEPLLRAAGWQPSTIAPIIDAALPPTLPVEINGGAIIFQIVEPAMLERGRNAAFFVIAERR